LEITTIAQRLTMPKSKIFEDQYPTIARFIAALGWIEIGEDDIISAFV